MESTREIITHRIYWTILNSHSKPRILYQLSQLSSLLTPQTPFPDRILFNVSQETISNLIISIAGRYTSNTGRKYQDRFILSYRRNRQHIQPKRGIKSFVKTYCPHYWTFYNEHHSLTGV